MIGYFWTQSAIVICHLNSWDKKCSKLFKHTYKKTEWFRKTFTEYVGFIGFLNVSNSSWWKTLFWQGSFPSIKLRTRKIKSIEDSREMKVDEVTTDYIHLNCETFVTNMRTTKKNCQLVNPLLIHLHLKKMQCLSEQLHSQICRSAAAFSFWNEFVFTLI